MKNCRKCGVSKSLDDYYNHSGMLDGKLNFCKDCVTSRIRIQRQVDDGVRAKERLRYQNGDKKLAAIRRWRDNNKARIALVTRVSLRVNRAVKKGILVKKDCCELCDRTNTRIEAAHTDYTNPLEVLWLCIRCHRKWDNQVPKTKSI